MTEESDYGLLEAYYYEIAALRDALAWALEALDDASGGRNCDLDQLNAARKLGLDLGAGRIRPK